MIDASWIRQKRALLVVVSAAMMFLTIHPMPRSDAAEGAPRAIFHHAHLTATDPATAIRWYQEHLGGRITKVGPFDAVLSNGVNILFFKDVWVLAKKADAQPAPTKGRSIDHVSWGFADLDAAAEDLKAKGINFVTGPVSFGGGRIGFIDGPDGVRIELVGPGKPGATSRSSGNSTKWRPLFDGKSLDGWTQRGGKAKYTVEVGQIVGTSVPKTPNSFLCTDRDYGDFILELECKVVSNLNSGVQIRSQCFDHPIEAERDGKKRTIPAGRVHGYQVEIDPSDRAWSGGIYDEGRRGWLDDLADNESARRAFKQGEWNKFRIECRGDSIKTWINGVAAADLIDDMTPRGFIALQVHGVGDAEDPRQVRWRNIRIQEL